MPLVVLTPTLRRLLTAAAGLLLAAAPAAGEGVVLQLRWDHQFQFAGYYAAEWQGFYAEAGLEVEIRSGRTPDGRPIEPTVEVAEGRADFGIGGADVIFARDRGMPLIVLASIFQDSPAAWYALPQTDFNDPTDLIRLRVFRRPDDLLDAEFLALLDAEGVRIEELETVSRGSRRTSIEALLTGEVDVVPGYNLTMPYLLQRAGVQPRVVEPEWFGINFYGDSIFTHYRTVRERPGLAQRFVDASLRGWRYAMQNPEEIAARIAAELPLADGSPGDPELNMFQISRVREAMLHPVVDPGHTNPLRWREMEELLERAGAIRAGPRGIPLVWDPDAAMADRRRRLQQGFILLGVITLVAGGLAWLITLRRALHHQTRALRERQQSLERLNLRLLEADRRLRRVLDGIVNFVAVLLPDGTVLEVNEAALRAAAIPREAVIGRHFWDTPWFGHDGEEQVRLRAAVQRAAGGETDRWDASLRIGDEGRTMDVRLTPLRDEDKVTHLIASAIDITERKAWEEHQRMLLAELSHRVKNTLALVQAIASETARRSGSLEEFSASYRGRLSALARMHSLLVNMQWSGVAVEDIARAALAPHDGPELARCDIGGPRVIVSPKPAQSLSMVFHELATNAAKYGALTTAEGRVELRWGYEPSRTSRESGDGRSDSEAARGGRDQSHFVLRWSEHEGPPVRAPERTGFGMELIRSQLAYELAAEIEYVFASEGVRCIVRIPRERLREGWNPQEQSLRPAQRSGAETGAI